MKKSKLIILSALVVTLLVVFSACGNGGGGGAADGGGAAAGGAAAGNGAGAAADFVRTAWNQPFPETVTVTIANDEMAHAIFPDGHDIFYTLWVSRWYELYNVNVETIWVSADYTLQMNLAIAAGDLPDMFASNAVQFQQLLDANLVEDITDTLQWLSPATQRILDDERLVFDTAMRDGRYFSIPRLHYGFITQAPYFWIRRDWYEQIGSPTINTIADLENVMQQMMDTFDEVEFPMVMQDGMTSFWYGQPMFHSMAHIGGQRMWIDAPDGSIMSAFEAPEFVESLRTFRRWYENGWIRADFATNDWDGMNADIVSGRSAMAVGQNWRGWGWNSVVEEFGPDSYLIVLPMPTIDGRPAQIPIHFANYAYDVVRRGFEIPEILPILTSDYVYVLTEAPITGSMTPDEFLPFNLGDMHHTAGPFRVVFPHYADVVEVLNAMDAYHAGTFDDFQFTSGYAVIYVEEIRRWVSDGEMPGLGRYQQMGHRQSSLAMGVQYEDNGQFRYTRQWGPNPQEVLDFASITDSIIEEGVTRIIMDLDPLEHWDVVLEDWRQAGGNAMTEAVNRYFGN